MRYINLLFTYLLTYLRFWPSRYLFAHYLTCQCSQCVFCYVASYNGIKDLIPLQLSRLPSLKALFLQGSLDCQISVFNFGIRDVK